MRVATLAALALAALFAAPASAQTYGTDYPVCLQVFGRISYFECAYTSIAQCNMSASGRAAQCVVNPYYATAAVAAPAVRHRRDRHVY